MKKFDHFNKWNVHVYVYKRLYAAKKFLDQSSKHEILSVCVRVDDCICSIHALKHTF